MKTVSLDVIEKYFSSVSFTDDIIKIDQCTEIFNIKKFYESHLNVLKANKGNKLMLPYYHRLNKLYNFYNKKLIGQS